ncbi:hypothetical protein CTAYLR_008696 [Chrysophaeum taylorii]|uniref:Pectate lyase superfamily protein domain-containing protein n=1 Tax=Chrysophaeum taylorii TaxID=2483200 RepID=A0AAD7XS98_9STRA|nr:hypothetical protein CTAYLR_008696 [Chrysophaeum taylorii]
MLIVLMMMPPAVAESDIPSGGGVKSCVVTAYGAVGDGSTDNTEAFRRCVADCAQHSASRVVVPAGVFVTGAFNLSSGTVLRVVGVIRAVPFEWDRWDYHWPAVRVTAGYAASRDACCVPWKTRSVRRAWQHAPLVGAFEAHDVAIEGPGTIDGNGESWWARFACQFAANAAQLVGVPRRALPVPAACPDDRAFRLSNVAYPMGRPRLVEFERTVRSRVEDVALRDSPFWTLHLADSREVVVRNVAITAPAMKGFGGRLWAPNSDGIDVDSCEDVLIDGVMVDVGDDAVAVKAGLLATAKPSTRVHVRNSDFRAQWVSIGSETAGGVRGVRFDNNSFGNKAGAVGSDAYALDFALALALGKAEGGAAGVHVKTRADRGGEIDDIVVARSRFTNSDAALWLSTSYPTEPGAAAALDPPKLGAFRLEDLTCEGCTALVRARGLPGSPVSSIDVVGAPPGPIDCANVRRLTVDGRSVRCREEAPSAATWIFFSSKSRRLFALALAGLLLLVATTRRTKPSRTRSARILLACSFCGTIVRAIRVLFSNVVGSTLSAPFATTPAPLTAPWLHTNAWSWHLSVAASCALGLGGLLGLAVDRSTSTALRLVLAAKATLVVAGVLWDGDRSRLRASYCAAAWRGHRVHAMPGDLLLDACADYLELGESAADAWGLATGFLFAAIAYLQLDESTTFPSVEHPVGGGHTSKGNIRIRVAPSPDEEVDDDRVRSSQRQHPRQTRHRSSSSLRYAQCSAS